MALDKLKSSALDTNIDVAGTLTSGAISASGNISTTSNTISITNSSYPQLQINGSTKNWSLFADAGGPLYLKNTTDNSNSVLIHPTGGVSFNGDTAAANALDDYEIGSFAPVYAISGGSVTTASNAGRYVKVGDFVFFTFRLRTTAVSGTGVLSMTLPFATTQENRSGGSRGYARDWGVDMPEFTIYTPPSSSVALFYRHAMNVSTAQEVTGSQMGTGGDDNVLEGSIVYRSA